MKKEIFVLIAIIFLAGFLRFLFLDKYPVAPNWDEVSHGVNAYSILKTGKDEWGVSFPLIFRAFGDYKLPFYIYLTIIPISLFGLSVFSLRFISALSGTLAILGIYLLTKKLFPDKKITISSHLTLNLELITAALLALMPWHFFISRPALEANLALTLTIFAGAFLISGLEKPKHFIYSALLFGLSLHTYNTSRVFVPLILLAYCFIYWLSLRGAIATRQSPIVRNLIVSVLLLSAFFSIVLYQILTGTGTARYGKLNIITESTAFTLGQKRLESGLPPFVARLVYNRPLYFAQTFANNYFGYFTTDFFNQSKGAQFQFAIPGRNLLGLPVVILFLIGILYLVKHPYEKQNQFIAAWLLLSPVAAALTVDPPQALRPNPMIPAIIIISGLGLTYLARFLREDARTLAVITTFALAVITFAVFLNDYFVIYPKNYSQSWQYGYKEVFEFLNSRSNFDKFFITKRYGEPHIFYAFFNQLDPAMLQPGPDNIRFEKSDWFWTDKIGDFYFVNDWQIPTAPIVTLPLESGASVSASRSLLVASPEKTPADANVIKTISFLDGTPAFKIVEIP